MRLTSANQAIIPLSMRSVFSRKPIASAKRRTARGLTIAVARPAPHSMAKANRSYPPVASSATKPTWCSLQNAINSVIPALSLVKRRVAPSRPSRTSSAAEQTSTPQIRSVTVTCLVHAIDNRATVRSCVTLQQAVPRLTSGCCQRGNGRRTPRTGSGGHLTPCSAAPITLRRRLLDTRVRAVEPRHDRLIAAIGHVVDEAPVAAAEIERLQDSEVAAILDIAARVACSPIEIDDAGILRMCRIDFAEYRAVQMLIGADGT